MPLALLRDLQGEELTRRYSAILDKLPRLSGIVGTIFLKAQNEIQDPPKLRRLVGLIDGDLARPRRRREGIPNRSKRSTTPL